MSPDNILLGLPAAQEDAVSGVFDALSARGFPRQQQTPHITITFAPHMDPAVIKRAGELLPTVIPATFVREGTVVFGTGRKQTVAWLLRTEDALERAARELSARNPDGRGDRWTPHLTVGLRLPREIVGEYVAALDELTPRELREITAERAGLLRPRTGEYLPLAP